MNDATWQNELQALLERFSGMGIAPDIATMGMTELWGVYCLLKRMAGR